MSPTPRRRAGELRVLGVLLVGLAVLARARAGQAQSPSADWRTLQTAHFRLHYPAPAEAWTRQAAARLEAIRERVVAEVGYTPPEVVDVLVQDPRATANGLAMPALNGPRLVLWTTPPLAESELGHFTYWSDLLITHEETHLAHLLRPSRNPLWRALSKAVPVGPIPLQAPRWVIEGYATLVEGRLTGAGRPNSAARAAVLRRWAQGGKLPGYGQLASDNQAWRGMSMAYLLGSAYLEWLEERAGPGSLRNLWARMTARKIRTFEQSFSGVFGDSPANLYDRFRAELTWRAIEAERLRRPPAGRSAPAGELWQDLSWTTGAPALSRDGKRIAIVLRSRAQAARLVVWSTEPDAASEKERSDAVAKLRARDPQDVPAVRARPLPRKALHSWTPPDAVDPAAPRFLPDGETILFVRFEPDGEGFLHPDLSLWSVADGRVRRLTHGADLRDPDPSPDGRWAVAARIRYGLSQLVRVDLATGAVEPLTEPSVEVVYDRPRLSPDGRRVAYACHRDGRWQIEVLDLESRASRPVSPAAAETAASPAWSADGSAIYAVLGEGGYLDLYRLPIASATEPAQTAASPATPAPGARTQTAASPSTLAPGASEQLTWMPGAAFAPAPAPDGKALYFLALEPDGLDLRRLDLVPASVAASPKDADQEAAAPTPDLFPALPPSRSPRSNQSEAAAPYPAAEVGASRPYGLGRPETQWLAGYSGSASGSAWEVGLRLGDLVGRLDLLALGAYSKDGQASGGALAGVYRGLPVEVRFHLFDVAERPGEDDSRPQPARTAKTERRGIEVGAAWERQLSAGGLELAGGVLWNEIEESRAPAGAEQGDLRQRLVSASGSYRRSRYLGSFGSLRQAWVDGSMGLRLATGQTGAGPRWERYGASLGGSLRGKQGRLSLALRRDGGRDLSDPIDLYRLGGPAPSILPATLLAQRRIAPGLPLDLLLGERAEEQRLELELSTLPAPLFYSRTRLWSAGERPGDWLALAGLELDLRIDPQPLARLPGFTLRAGVANVVSAPAALRRLDGDWRWWISTSWRP